MYRTKVFSYKKEALIKRGDFLFWINKYKNETTVLHRHNFFEIFYVVEGTGIHCIDGHKTSLSKGDIFLLNPKEAHEFVIPPGKELIIICCTFFPSLLDEHILTLRRMRSFLGFTYLAPFYRSKKEKLHLSGMVDITVRNLLEEMLEEYKSKKSDYQLVIKAKLLNLLVVLNRLQELMLSKKDWIDRKRDTILKVLQYIDKHYGEKIQLKEIADISNMSPNYFCEIFKKITGKTLIEYINDLRLTKACLLLKETDLTVSEICYKIGFSDFSHFEYMFKRHTGVSPLKFRK